MVEDEKHLQPLKRRNHESKEGITQMNKFKPTNLLELKLKQPYR